LKQAFARARLVLWWESVWPAIWPPLAVALLFLGVAWLELPSWIGGLTGGWGQLALLVVFGLGFLVALRHGLLQWRPRDEDGVIRRLERDSALSHRPISGLMDKPAGDMPDPSMRTIWAAHRLRLLAQLPRVRVAAPDPAMVRIDPWGLRVLVGLVLVSGLLVSSGDRIGRVAKAFDVALAPLSGNPPPTLDVWINPPSYTGRPPVLLARAQQVATGMPADAPGLNPAPTGRIEVPIGSSLIAKVNGGDGPVSLVLGNAGAGGGADGGANGGGDASSGPATIPFEAIGTSAHQLEANITRGSRLEVRQDGEALASWDLTLIPDLKPTIAFAEDPSPTERGALTLHYSASDDYGVAEVAARIHLLDSTGEATSDEPFVLTLTLPRIGLEVVDSKDYHDLTPHPWAGQPVGIELLATDEAGQQGVSERLRMLLPEKVFTHPVARAVIEQRKRLVTEPSEYADIGQILMALASRPGRYYDDAVTFLGLKMAATRLVLNGEDRVSLSSVQALLWDIALRIEDGELSLAARELRELERRILDMLAQDDVDEEALEQLLDELKASIDKMLQAMMEQMQQDMAQQDGGESQEQMQEVDPNQLVERQDLMDMIDRAREMMKSGAKDAAREMLSKLREMMENLQAGRPQPMSPQQQAAQEMMRQLQDLAEQQRRLMDDTYKSHQDGSRRDGRSQNQMNQMPGQQSGQQESLAEQLRRQLEQQFGRRPGEQGQQQQGQGQQGQGQNQQGRGEPMSAEELAQMQEQLRGQLGEFMRRLAEGMGQIPDPLGQAERAMKDAGQALGQQQPGEAVGPQGEALEALQQGAEAIREQMRQMQQANGGATPDPNAQGRGQGQDRNDPLQRDGENQGFANDDGSVGIPGESDMQRARRIFDELRRRSGDQSRPELELDYIERLLKRF
jgi:uncharacterized protein (TIGR02302 family)